MVRHPRRSVALVSGGVESAALVARLLRRGDRVTPIYVRSGYRWEKTELRRLGRLLEALKAPRLKPLVVLPAPARHLCGAEHWGFTGRRVPGAASQDAAVYLPGRNLLLLSAAAVYCARNRIEAVALGTLRGNPFPDARPGFFSSMERALTSGLGRKLSIETPFRRLSKRQVIRAAGKLPWELTFSCIAPARGRACGRCNKCAERRKALRTV